MENKKKKIFSNIFLIIFFMCVSLLVVYVIQLAYYGINNKKPFLKIYTIVSSSMEPNINIYDMVFVNRVLDESELKKGDIITFYSDELLDRKYTVTHRIDKVLIINGEKYYQTKGDNNMHIDPGLITFDDIQGKVNYIIPKVGKIQSFVMSKRGWICLILIPALLLLIYDVYKIITIRNSIL